VELKATLGPLHWAPERRLHITDDFTLVDEQNVETSQTVEQLT
jgi:hypothetical protein